jgi:hypothetical protein
MLGWFLDPTMEFLKTRGSIIQDVKWININLLLTTMWMMSLQFLKN